MRQFWYDQTVAVYEHGFRRPEPGDEDFIDHVLNIVGQECPYLCPFCGGMYNPDNAQYEYIDFGHYQQVSPNYCDLCGASELGHYRLNPKKQVYSHGWVRDRLPDDGDKYPIPPWVELDETESRIEFVDDPIELYNGPEEP